MTSDLSAIAVLLPQPLLDRLETLRQSRKLSSIQEALLIVLSEYFVGQPNSPKSSSAGDVSQLEARLFRTEALLAALIDRVTSLEGHSLQRAIVSTPDTSEDIEDEPDEVLLSFLEDDRASASPIPSASDDDPDVPHPAELAAEKAIALGRNLGWTIQPNGRAQPLTYEEIEEEPDEILYDFLEPG
ncbi:hypothetical protein [Leptolyngbya ohadii]|uniref:hypothetical protein n=1 Tax=Leptolyngbya ohadii TaxID=1962290 RepID=UPI000B59F5E6|nr:hypothetical protein [Leptolyngbya ohadii]